MNCKKCDSIGQVILRKKDNYCEQCFLTTTNHKFRASIGKNKILTSNQKVLICLSGGLGSTVLLDLIYNGVSLDNHKKLRIIPHFIHVTGLSKEEDNLKIINSLLESSSNYGFNMYIVHISDYVLTDIHLHDENTQPVVNDQAIKEFQNILKTMPLTVKNDFLKKIKRNLIIRYAKKLDCKYVFTGETATTLATNLLSNISMGRGSQVQNDIGFCDNRNDEITIIKAMRDISREELDHYINIKKLNVVHEHDLNDNSLQSVINKFVADLQENFQATISTICKTADKIGIKDQHQNSDKCLFCEQLTFRQKSIVSRCSRLSTAPRLPPVYPAPPPYPNAIAPDRSNIGRKTSKLSALEATNYSKSISMTQPQKECVINVGTSENNKPSMFPLIHKTLCYSCSRNYSEMTKGELPNCITDRLHN